MIILYITFIDIVGSASTGSAVRPKKMLEAFKETGIEVKLLEGLQNRRGERRKKVRDILRWLDNNRPDLCYVEPPSGPFFNGIDHTLLRRLHKMQVPVGLFYRDAYWMFPDYERDGKERNSIWNEFKMRVVRIMQKRDLRLFKKNCDHIFFPSETMGQYFDFPHSSALPPGCVNRPIDYGKAFVPGNKPIQFIFVGGAAINYGTDLTLKAFRKVNKDNVIAKLTYICPQKQWDAIKSIVYRDGDERWLKVLHLSGDEQLLPNYVNADVAILTAPRTEYRDFAVPIKIYEYISYNLPILVTNCKETEKIVLSNDVGWSVEDSVDAVSASISYLYSDQKEIVEKKSNCYQACMNNLWKVRAQEVIRILSEGNR